MNEYYNKATGLMPGQMREMPMGATLGAEMPKQVPPVGVAMEQMQRELTYLREALSSLEQRLSPVMRPVPACTSGSDKDYPGGSALVATLAQMSDQVRHSAAQVHMMLDCIEL